jgi:NitT/TauT family transport system substrate-binding protein
MNIIKKFVIFILVLGVFFTTNSFNKTQAKEITKIVFSLDFIVLGRHSPWYVALDKGFYKAEGLDVKIIPGKGTASVIRNIEGNVAQIGFVDVPGLVMGRAKGSSIKMLAVNYQKAPYAVFSLDPGANVTTLKDLEGLTLTTAPGSFVPKIIEAFMAKNGLDPKKLKYDYASPSVQIPMLMTGKAAAINFFILTMPGISRAAKGKGKTAKALFFGDFGLDIYANGIAAKEEFIQSNPNTVRKFVRASLKGWQHTFANPADAATRQKKYSKGLNKQITIEEIAILKKLAVTPETKKYGLGWFSEEKMASLRDFMVNNTQIDKSKAPKASDLYDRRYLPKNPIKP